MNFTWTDVKNFSYILLINILCIINDITILIFNTVGTLTKKGFEYCGRHRIITDKNTDEAYLERYYLLLKDRKDFPFNIFIHKFLKSDPDHLHDHPWPYFTCILRGGYFEHTPAGKFWRSPFTCKCNKATDLHKIELDPNVENCWTLFIPGKKERDWGFKTDDGWIPNDEYTNKKDD